MNRPTLAHYILWVALVLGLLALAEHLCPEQTPQPDPIPSHVRGTLE